MILFGIYPHTVWGTREGPFSHVREWPLAKENARGGPSTPTLAVCSLNDCTTPQCKCSVHGFAMNPYVSLRLATAPYYREARVTVARRQTACRMRRLALAPALMGAPVDGDWGRTAARLAERHPQGCAASVKSDKCQQRSATADNRSRGKSYSNTQRGSARYGQCNRQALQPLRAARLQWKPFSWGFKGVILFCKRMAPLSRSLRGAGEQSTALPRCDMLPLTFFEG